MPSAQNPLRKRKKHPNSAEGTTTNNSYNPERESTASFSLFLDLTRVLVCLVKGAVLPCPHVSRNLPQQNFNKIIKKRLGFYP